jgi:predicted RNA binding protein YcfA (HicA-like mRNA interferase family)
MSRLLRQVKASEVVRVAKRLGFVLDHQTGSHAVYYRSSDGRRVVVPMHGSRALPIGTVRAMLRDMDIRPGDYEHLK